MAKKRRKVYRTRKAWGYPADLDRPYRPGDRVVFATACSCGWRKSGLPSLEEAERLTKEHEESTGHEPDYKARKI